VKTLERQAKFYKRHEKVIMKKLDFEPVVGSGAGWINKEDGESELFIAQLKSTDKNSFTIKREDLDKLEYHAKVSHKLPVFINEFLEDEKIYITIPLDDIDLYIKAYLSSEAQSNGSSEFDRSVNNLYYDGILNESRCHSEALEMVQIDGGSDRSEIVTKKVIKSGGRNRYQKIREKEKEKEYADFKLNKRRHK